MRNVNHTNNPRGGGKGSRGEVRNKGIKKARDQERRERAYERGADRPRERDREGGS
jgi:hypothetical protein